MSLHNKIWEQLKDGFFQTHGVNSHQIESFDEFVQTTFQEIISDSLPIDIVSQNFRLTLIFDEITFTSPYVLEHNGDYLKLQPSDCRTRNLSYVAPVFLKVLKSIYHHTDTIQNTQNEVLLDSSSDQIMLGYLPVMVKSCLCNLKNNSQSELIEANECDLDPGGYFIINGNEKVLVTQERMTINQIFCFNNKKDPPYCEIRSISETSSRTNSASTIYFVNPKKPVFRILIGYLKKPIPICLVFFALGIIEIQDIVLLICKDLKDQKLVDLLLPSIEESYQHDVENLQSRALKNIAQKAGSNDQSLELHYAFSLLSKYFLPHISIIEGHKFKTKAYFLAEMIRKFAFCLLGRSEYDDRDHLANKRMDCSGPLLSMLAKQIIFKTSKDAKTSLERWFTEFFDHQNLEIETQSISQKLQKSFKKLNLASHFPYQFMTKTFSHALATGNWVKTKNAAPKTGISQILSRFSHMAFLSHLRRISSTVSREGKVVKPRQLHNTHWSRICAFESPEGAQCLDQYTLIDIGIGYTMTLQEAFYVSSINRTKQYNLHTNQIEFASFYFNQKKSCKKLCVEVTFQDSTSIICTYDHKILCQSHGQIRYVQASQLQITDFVFKSPQTPIVQNLSLFENFKILQLDVLSDLFNIQDKDEVNFEIISKLLSFTRILGLCFFFRNQNFQDDISGFTIFCYHKFDLDSIQSDLENTDINFQVYKCSFSSNTYFLIEISLQTSKLITDLLLNDNLYEDLFQNMPVYFFESFANAYFSYCNDLDIDIFQSKYFDAKLLGKKLHSDRLYFYYNHCKQMRLTLFHTFVKSSKIDPNIKSFYSFVYLLDKQHWFEKKIQNSMYKFTNNFFETTFLMPVLKITKINTKKVVHDLVECSNGNFQANSVIVSNCGIVKNFALTARTTLHSQSSLVLDVILSENKDSVFNVEQCNLSLVLKYLKLFINGNWTHSFKIDSHSSILTVLENLKYLRRKRYLPADVSISFNEFHFAIIILCDNGRIIRPLIVLKENKMVIDENCLKFNLSPKAFWNHLVSKGCIDYIDTLEEGNCNIAMFEKDLQNSSLNYDYLEIHPSFIMGICASIIPFPDSNQAPRNVYSASMSKQSMGVYASNYQNRYDTIAHSLWSPQKPLVSTSCMDYPLQTDELPAGQNVIIAVQCFSGYNQEDSLIINQDSINRGILRSDHLRTYQDEESKFNSDQMEQFCKPQYSITNGIKSHLCYEKLDQDGLVLPFTQCSENDIIIGKTTPNIQKHDQNSDHNSFKTKKDKSTSIRSSETGVVDQVMIASNTTGSKTAKIRLRSTRIPEMGDKFCLTSDHEILTQKGFKYIDKMDLSDKIAILNEQNSIHFENPKTIHKFSLEDEFVYHLTDDLVELTTTLNHKMYVNLNNTDFSLRGLEEIFCFDTKQVEYTCQHTLSSPQIINYWITKSFELRLNLYFRNNLSQIYLQLSRIPNSQKWLFQDIIFILKSNQIPKCDILFPQWIWLTNSCQMKSMVLCLFSKTKKICEISDNDECLINNIQRMCFLGNVFSVKSTNKLHCLNFLKKFSLKLYRSHPKLMVNHKNGNFSRFSGFVFCPEVSSGIFLVRKNGKLVWTGNSSRHGQKGTCGLVMPAIDMPWTVEGLVPDIIMNPHAFPSRMTIAHLIETLAGKSSLMHGKAIDATSFNDVKPDEIAADLHKAGYSRYGKEVMYSGLTGEPLDATIFIGPCYYERLKHLVADKLHCLTMDHEILTFNGWKFFHQLQKSDLIACLKDGVLNYESAKKTYHYPEASTKIHTIKNEFIDITVTNYHKMFVSQYPNLQYCLEEVQNIVGNRYYLTNAHQYIDNDFQLSFDQIIDHFSASRSNKNNHIHIIFNNFLMSNMNIVCSSFLSLFGLVFEFSRFNSLQISPFTIVINKNIYINNFIETKLKELQIELDYSIDYEINDDNFIIYDQMICFAFSILMNQSVLESNLPSWTKLLSQKQSTHLLTGLFVANKASFSHFHLRNEKAFLKSEFYASANSLLCDQIQQLIIHSSFSSIKHSVVLKKLYRTFAVTVETNHNPVFDHKLTVSSDFMGPVFCLQVSSGVFMVRRNGKAVWTGNSRNRGPKTMLVRQPCWKLSTRVMMFDGTSKQMIDIVNDYQKGDRSQKICGDDGTERQIVDIIPVTPGEMFTVKQTKGCEYVVNGDHTLVLRVTYKNPKYKFIINRGKYYHYITWLSMCGVLKKKYQSQSNSCKVKNCKAVKYFSKRFDSEFDAKHALNEMTFSNNWNQIGLEKSDILFDGDIIKMSVYQWLNNWCVSHQKNKSIKGFKAARPLQLLSSIELNLIDKNLMPSYLLGLWIITGIFECDFEKPFKTLKFFTDDPEIESYLKRFCAVSNLLIQENNFRIGRNKTCERKKHQWQIYYRFEEPTNWNNRLKLLQKLNILNYPSITRSIPKNYLNNPDNKERLDLLAAFIDSDGSVQIDKRQKNGVYYAFSQCETNKLIVDQVKYLAETLNIHVSGPWKRRNGYDFMHIIELRGSEICKIPCKVYRKIIKNVCETPHFEHIQSSILTITKNENEKEYCGVTLNNNGLFLLPDRTVVHNCEG